MNPRMNPPRGPNIGPMGPGYGPSMRGPPPGTISKQDNIAHLFQ